MSTEEETEEKLLEGSNSANKNLIALSAKVGAAQKSQVSQSDAKVFRRSLSSKLKIWMAPPKERRVFAQDSDAPDIFSQRTSTAGPSDEPKRTGKRYR
ncbi:uncharacterized protein LOC120785466 isoform X3 [Xiphias gladius]|uniref:uncharacterized protein LOC120785466 isoform X3 n=1 Tax=Xiphias gladius TaxID=8245 RepID=UPI001A98D4C0|nr:uncharacterized protein LOC120785466 isoform X3 [Xiphias gladius]